MIKTVIKRNGEVVDFNKEKIVIAITKANNETEEMSTQDILDSANQVVDSFNQDSVDVETIQDKVEEVLMLNKHTRTAKEYIIYREERKQERKRDIFKPRKNLKPYEYPELEKYKEAIQHSYWLHTEYNYTSDIQDYKVNVKDHERTAIKNSMLAIAQIEVDVKEFWGDLYKRLPKPELANVGHTFAESEVRHSDAYAHLLELLGLNNEFEKIDEIPALRNRVNYLRKHNEYARTGNDRDYAIAILLFSAFVEHISLFSQFLIIMSFNKYSNLFSGISNAIEATSKEEQLHGEFGVELINTIREEKPKWFDDSMANDIYDLVKEAYKSEHEVLDWIFEDGELEFMPRYTVEEFIKNRLNNEFEKIDEIPALRNRVNYLRKHNEYARTGNDRDYAIAILLFSAFVEHISLFSQFLIIMSFNKYSNLFSGISNAIEATSKEEQLHGEFGVELINTIKEEKPKWFDDSMANDIYDLVKEAYKSEHEVLDWIFEDGELEFMPRYTVEEFIKNRLNNSLEAIGLERIFDVDEKEVEKTDWFDDEVVATKHVDFFEKRSVNYTKRSRSITADDLF